MKNETISDCSVKDEIGSGIIFAHSHENHVVIMIEDSKFNNNIGTQIYMDMASFYILRTQFDTELDIPMVPLIVTDYFDQELGEHVSIEVGSDVETYDHIDEAYLTAMTDS